MKDQPSLGRLSHYLYKASGLNFELQSKDENLVVRSKIDGVKILMARDDIILKNGAEEIETEFPGQTIVLDDGGHLGYWPLFWFDRLVYEEIGSLSGRERSQSHWENSYPGTYFHSHPMLGL